MNLSSYNTFCRSLPHTHHVVQWGDAHVWKVGGDKGKVFAIASQWDGPSLDITFKVSQLTFDLLKHQPGMRPHPTSPRAASSGCSGVRPRRSMTRH